MTPEQIAKWGSQANDTADDFRIDNPEDPTPWRLLRDTEFARLVAADTWERAARMEDARHFREWKGVGMVPSSALSLAFRAAAVKEPRP